MALDLNALTAYTDEHAMGLIKESILTGRTVDLLQVQGGIKSSATINRLSTDLVASAGACGWDPKGTTTLDQRTISVNEIKINEAICVDDLNDFYTQVMMNPGSYNTEIPFEQLYAENKRDAIKALNEDLIWRGDTGATGNLALADGFIKLFDDEETANNLVLHGTYAAVAGSIDGTIVIDTIDEIVGRVPENIINNDDLIIVLSYADYRTYAKALRDSNLFHYTGAEDQGGDFTMMVPGTNVRVYAMKGLSGQGKIGLLARSNGYIGTDLMNDAENFKIFYSQDNDEVRFLAKWKLGVQVAFIEEVVWYSGV